MMKQFQNQVMIITGAASGFGNLLSEKLSAAGAKLALGGLNLEGLEALGKELGGEVYKQACDVSKEAQVKGLCDLAEEKFGRLDIACAASVHIGQLSPFTKRHFCYF